MVKMSKADNVAAVGALSLDTLSFHDGRRYENVFGGSAGYASLGASYFTDTLLISNIGEDYPPDLLINLKKMGIDTRGVRHVPETATTRFDIRYDSEMKETAGSGIDLNALEKDIRFPGSLADHRYLYIAVNDPEIQMKTLERSEGDHEVAVSTHKYWIERDPELVKRILGRSDIVFITDSEIKQLTGKKQLRNAAIEILRTGISNLVVRKGEHGAILFQRDRMYPFISYDRLDMEYVDPTGCGGVLAGAFLGFLGGNEGRREPLKNAYFKALAFGLVVRSFKLEDVSYRRLLTLDRRDIWRRYDRFRDMIDK